MDNGGESLIAAPTGVEAEIIIPRDNNTTSSQREEANNNEGDNDDNHHRSNNNTATTITTRCRDIKKFFILCIFLFIIFPILPLLLGVIFGALLALFEGDDDATFQQAFLYVVSNLLGLSTPLTEYDPSGTTVAVIIDLYVALSALLVFGICLNIVNLFQVPQTIDGNVKKCFFCQRVGIPPFVITMIAIGIIIPLWNAAMSVLFGCLLAWIEDWSTRDGILYVFGNTLGLGTPLTDVTPISVGGAIVDIILSSMALGYIAIFADYVTVLNPARYIRETFYHSLVKHHIIEPEDHLERHPLEEYANHNNNNNRDQNNQPDDDDDNNNNKEDGILNNDKNEDDDDIESNNNNNNELIVTPTKDKNDADINHSPIQSNNNKNNISTETEEDGRDSSKATTTTTKDNNGAGINHSPIQSNNNISTETEDDERDSSNATTTTKNECDDDDNQAIQTTTTKLNDSSQSNNVLPIERGIS